MPLLVGNISLFNHREGAAEERLYLVLEFPGLGTHIDTGQGRHDGDATATAALRLPARHGVRTPGTLARDAQVAS